jgi:plastocyanin
MLGASPASRLRDNRMNRLRILLASLLLLSAAAPAQEWRMAPEYDVLLSSYDIAPQEIRLPAGKAVRLRFVNNSNQGHDFSAPRFFSHARLRDRDRSTIDGGRISLGPLQARTIALVPEKGRYKVRSGGLFHRMFGMTAVIVVE